MKEVIGSFAVTNGTSRQQTVIISQEITLDTAGTIIGKRKILTLNTPDGEEIARGDSDSSFTLADGTILRKTSAIRFGDPEDLAPRRRRSTQP